MITLRVAENRNRSFDGAMIAFAFRRGPLFPRRDKILAKMAVLVKVAHKTKRMRDNAPLWVFHFKPQVQINRETL